MLAFVDEQGKAVIKPLGAMAGRSVFVTGVNDGLRNVFLETLTDRGNRYAMIQKSPPRDRGGSH